MNVPETKFERIDRRRESSRFAARDRRGKEASVFMDMRGVVPIVDEVLKTSLNKETGNMCIESTLLESLDGFLAIVDTDGVILYISESVSIFLGFTQTDLTGRCLKEFVHRSDYEEFARYGFAEDVEGKMMTVRMKSVISPRGRNLNFKSALFMPVVFCVRTLLSDIGRVRVIQGSARPAGQGSITAVAKGVGVPSGNFLTRHTCDMKFSYVSERFNYILRIKPRSLIGTSLYSLVHPADLDNVVRSIREMLAKGHTLTPYYRLIGFSNSVIWVQTEATSLTHTLKGGSAKCSPDNAGSTGKEDEKSLFRNKRNSGRTLFRARDYQKQRRFKATALAKKGSTQFLVLPVEDVEPPFRGQEYAQNRSYAFDTGIIAEFGSQSDGALQRPQEAVNSTDQPAQYFTMNYSTKDSITGDNVSTVQTTDAHMLPNTNVMYNRRAEYGDLFSVLSPADPQFTKALNSDGCRHFASLNNQLITAACGVFPVKESGNESDLHRDGSLMNLQEDTTYDGEDWQFVAPSVANDDMLHLRTDFQGFLRGFSLNDWISCDSSLPHGKILEMDTASMNTRENSITPISRPYEVQSVSEGKDFFPDLSAAPLPKTGRGIITELEFQSDGPLQGCWEAVNTTDEPAQYFTVNYSTKDLITCDDVSTVRTTGTYMLPDINVVHNRRTGYNDLFSVLSPVNPQFTNALNSDGCHDFATLNNELMTPACGVFLLKSTGNGPDLHQDDSFMSLQKGTNYNGENWQFIAPYVANEDMLQLVAPFVANDDLLRLQTNRFLSGISLTDSIAHDSSMPDITIRKKGIASLNTMGDNVTSILRPHEMQSVSTKQDFFSNQSAAPLPTTEFHMTPTFNTAGAGKCAGTPQLMENGSEGSDLIRSQWVQQPCRLPYIKETSQHFWQIFSECVE